MLKMPENRASRLKSSQKVRKISNIVFQKLHRIPSASGVFFIRIHRILYNKVAIVVDYVNFDKE